MADYDEQHIRNELLNKYDKLSCVIKLNEPCYALSSDWSYTFKFILDETQRNPQMLVGHPGPIDNISLLHMEEDHKQAMRCAITEEASNASKIDSLTDWSRMKLKTNLKYQDDFVLVSKEIWEFLVNLFGGGPTIELFSERNFAGRDQDKLVDDEKEFCLEAGLCVSLNLTKLVAMRNMDSTSCHTFFVSLGVDANSFFKQVCNRLRVQFNKCDFSYMDSRLASYEIKSYSARTLGELGITEDCVLNVTNKTEENPIFDNANEPRHFYSETEYEEQKNDWLNDSIYKESNFGGGGVERVHDNTSTKTVSTGIPNQNSFDLNDCLLGEEEINFKDQDIFKNYLVSNKCETNIIELQDKIKTTVKEERIRLTFKPINDIRKSLNKLQSDWLQLMKPKTTQKF